MGEDVVVVDNSTGRDSISALPETYLEALSAIQEQAFIEAGLEDPDYYSEAFTLKHRLSFFKTGLFAGLEDCILTLIGMVLYVLGKIQAVPVFGYSRGTFDFALAFVIVTFPYIATLILTIRTFTHISGTISKKMAFWLVCGFTEGSVLTTALLFAFCYAVATEWKNQIYLHLLHLEKSISFLKGISFLKETSFLKGAELFLQKVESFFWYDLTTALVRGSWDELKLSAFVSAILFFVFFVRSLWLKKKQHLLP